MLLARQPKRAVVNQTFPRDFIGKAKLGLDFGSSHTGLDSPVVGPARQHEQKDQQKAPHDGYARRTGMPGRGLFHASRYPAGRAPTGRPRRVRTV